METRFTIGRILKSALIIALCVIAFEVGGCACQKPNTEPDTGDVFPSEEPLPTHSASVTASATLTVTPTITPKATTTGGVFNEQGVLISDWDSLIDKGLVEVNENVIVSAEIESETLVIPGEITEIGDNAFSDCKNLKTVVFPEGTEKIGAGAFLGCLNLENVEVPDGIKEIGDAAFKDCISLTEIELPNTVTVIGTAMFDGCSSLEICRLPLHAESKNDTVAFNVIKGCGALKEIRLPKGIRTISADAFIGCTNLEEVDIPPTVTEITVPEGMYDNYKLFADCASLKLIYLHKDSPLIEILKEQGYGDLLDYYGY